MRLAPPSPGKGDGDGRAGVGCRRLAAGWAEGRVRSVCSAAADCRRGGREDRIRAVRAVPDEILADRRAAAVADREDAPIM